MSQSLLSLSIQWAVHLLTLLLLPPLIPGLINKVKAAMAGRNGPPVLQLYYDLAKLARKRAVFSRTTTWVFLAGPIGSVAAGLVAGLLVPFGHTGTPVMVLDHSGRPFALVLYGASLKLLVLGALLLDPILPRAPRGWQNWLTFYAGLGVLALAVGLVESMTARFRMTKVPQFLVAGILASAFAFLLLLV